MGHEAAWRIVVVHNSDFDSTDPEVASRADVQNAARDVAQALRARGHQASVLPVEAGDPLAAVHAAVAAVRAAAPDLVFNLCESIDGDARHEALLPGLFELARVPYTGSGPLALGIALRKDACKRILCACGVATPEAVTLDSDDVSGVDLPFPLIVKPSREDASIGITHRSVVHDRRALRLRVAEVRRRYRQPVLVERYIEGRELYVSLVGNGASLRALPMHEIDFSPMPAGRPRIVSYDAKWTPGSVDYLGTPVVRAEQIDEATRLRCEAAAKAAFRALELRDYARVDVRLDAQGTPWVIDVNPNCDLSDGAGVSRAASYAGWAYADLIDHICRAALARARGENHAHADELASTHAVERRAAEAAQGGRPAAPRGPGRARRSLHRAGGGGRARADRRGDR